VPRAEAEAGCSIKLTFAPAALDGNDRSADTAITFCSDGSLCCGRKNSACCDAGRGVSRVGNTTTTNTKPGSLTSSASSTVSLGPAVTTGANSTSSRASSPSLPTGAAIGTGVGAGIGGIIIIICVVLVFRALKKRKARKGVGVQDYQQPPLSGSTDAWKHKTVLAEVGADDRLELAGVTVTNDARKSMRPDLPAELYGTGWKGGR
jgi:hypothetical protein